jgi:hypothetical protein
MLCGGFDFLVVIAWFEFSEGLFFFILMGDEVVCVQALEDERTENNEESKTELKRDYDQCIADTEPNVSPKKTSKRSFER